MSSPSHVPVLLDRVVALLAPALDHEGAVMVDATLGLGGHTEAVLRRCELARVVGIDRDPAALALAAERLAPYGDRFTGVHAVYDEIPEVLADLGLDAVDAVLFDLGVSSMQLDVPERGFAYREDAPLDMRMDGTTGPPPPTSSTPTREAELTRVLREYGEERFARRIAAAVVRERDRSRSPPRRGSSSCCTPRSPRRPAGPAATPPSAPSRRCGWRSTTSSPCCAGRCRPPSTRSGSAAAWSSSPTTRSRTGWSSRRSPRPPAATCPPDLPFVPEGHEPALRLVTRGAEKADPQRDRGQPPGRVGAAAGRSNAVRPDATSLPPRSSSPGRPAPLARSPRSARRRSSGPGCGWCPRRRTRARVPFVDAVSLLLLGGRRRAAAASTPRCSRPRSRPPRWRSRPQRSPRASRPCRWSSTCSATPSGSPSRRSAWAWCPRHQPAYLELRLRQGARRACTGRARRRPQTARPAARRSRPC